MTTKIKKPYRVTQYEQLSEVGLALFPVTRTRNQPVECWSKDYRWKWQARIMAALSRGESAGFGLRILSATVKDLRDQSESGKL